MNKRMLFLRGMKDGLPIMLGYISISLAFGMLAVENGVPLWAALVTSATSVTGTGQFVGIDMLARSAAFTQIFCTVLVINLRYVLMSLSWSQKLDPKIGILGRALLAYGNTDEVFAVSMAQPGALSAEYLAGLILTPVIGWCGGTLLGAVASSILPAALRSALGISIYAMFLAIIIPPARDARPVTEVIVLAVAMSLLMRFLPGVKNIDSGWRIILCGVLAAGYAAWKHPMEDKEAPHADI